uniref:Matrix-remodelling associated 5a n=1 Tax=Oryzias latipes TaxID=8090 RepID=A0A3P9MBI0_ORYLA
IDGGTMRALRCLLALVLLFPRAAPARCPRPCTCPQLEELHCTFRSLLSVPGGLPVELRRINLGFNRLSGIPDGSVGGLRQLELLMLHGNNIRSVSDGAFRDLGALQMLKMSYNELQELRRNTLQGLRSLARLHLDHNRLEFIHPQAFQGLTSLKLLQLEANRLQQLHPDTFCTFTARGLLHVSTLRHLYLSENGLRSLPARLLDTMPQLENLYLHGNPWTCDCSMRWFQDWKSTFPGILKCKKVPPSSRLCPICSSPRHLHGTELHAAENLVCSVPVISLDSTEDPPQGANTERLSIDDFRDPVGNASLELQDEHRNKVDLKCRVGPPRDLAETTWQQVTPLQLSVNISFSVDLKCPVGSGKYEQLWRLIAYYSRAPAHLDRGAVLNGGGPPAYAYTQNPATDALYYTGLRVSMATGPAWLMQPSLDLQLDRAQSSQNTVGLVLKTRLSETLDLQLLPRQRRPWVLIWSTNTSQEVHSAVLGSASQMTCSTHSSEPAGVRWILPDGSIMEAPGPDRRVSVTQDGRLLIGAVTHADTGAYYCIAKVHGDFAVHPFYLAVFESSGAPPGGDGPMVSTETPTGSPISLNCSASGSPEPDVSWILPDNSIVGLRTNSSRARVFSNGTLVVQKVQASDAGYYRCVAMNNQGTDTAASKVIVLKRRGPMGPSRKPQTGPQPAAGVSTRVEVLAGEAEEASGAPQMEEPTSRPHAVRRIPAEALVLGRKRHPHRNARKNHSVLRNPSGPMDHKVLVERRTTNVTNNRIDPGKWASILAKIRDRNKTTSLLVQNQSESRTSLDQRVPMSVLKEQPETTKHTGPDQRVLKEQPETAKHTSSDQRVLKEQPETTKHISPDQKVLKEQPETTKHKSPDQRVLKEQPETAKHTSPDQRVLKEQPETIKHSSPDQRVLKEKPETTKHTSPDQRVLKEQPETTKHTGPDQRVLKEQPETTKHTSPDQRVLKEQPETTKHTGPDQRVLKEQPETTKHKSPDQKVLKEQPETTKHTSPDQRVLKEQPETTKHKSPDQVVTPFPNTHQPPNTAFLPVPVQSSTLSLTWNHELTTGGGVLHPLTTTTLVHTSTPRWSSTNPPNSRTPSPPNTRPGKGNPDGSATRPGNLQTQSQVPDLSLSGFMQTSVAPTPKPLPPTRQSRTRPRKPASRRGNSGRRKRPNRRKHTAVKAPPTSGTPAPTNRQQSEVAPTTTVVQFSDGQTPSFSEVSHDPDPRTSSTPAYSYDVEDSLLLATPPLQPPSAATPSLRSAYDNPPATTESPSFPLSPLSSSQLPGTPQEPVPADPLLDPESSVGGSLLVIRTSAVRPETTVPPAGSANTPSAPEEAAVKMSTASSAAPSRPDPVQPSRTTPYRLAPTPSATRDSPTLAQLKPPQSEPPTETLSLSPQTQSWDSRWAGPAPGGKPWTPPGRLQTVSVKAEADAQLPCGGLAALSPSWTRAATGMYDSDPLCPPLGQRFTQGSGTQRFEVHPNGTLTIRNTQMTDSGQYFCTVQNQHGLKEAAVNLVVQPSLATRHRDVSVLFGGTVDLECEVEERPESPVLWVLPSQARLAAGSEASQRRVAVHKDGTLQIQQVDLSDRGMYRCVTEAGLSAVSVHLNVLAEPPVIQQVQYENQTLAEGSSTFIHCTATGVPQPVIHWITPDGVRFTAIQLLTRPDLLIFPNGTLYLPKLGPQSSGTYECYASNALASSWRTVTVNVKMNQVLAKATITTSSPQRTDWAYGGRLLLDCVAAGHPEPRILWRTPSKKLVDAQYSFDPRIRVFPNGTIAVQSVTERDAGDYLCLARNKMGDDYVRLRVDVLMRPAKIEQKQPRSQQEVVYGGDLTVDCVASGLPPPQISWALPDGTMVNPGLSKDAARSGQSRRYGVFENGTLYLNHVSPHEEGIYTCYAENLLGKDEVKVRVRVTNGASPPRIQDKGSNTARVLYGETATLGCIANGNPVPTITWWSPSNRVIQPGKEKYHVMSNGSLVVQDAQSLDEGNYTCKASSSAGQDHKVTRLEVSTPFHVAGGVGGAADIIKVTAVEGQSKVVDCAPFGIPAPHVLWILPGHVVLPAPYHSDGLTVHPNGTLEMRSLKTSDSGQLVCFARKEGGEVRMVFSLDVRKAARMTPANGPMAESVPLTPGSTVSLNCSFDTLTLPQLTWILPDGTVLLRGARLFKFFHRHDGTLVISNPSAAESGTYRCLGQSPAGLLEREVTLSPRMKPEITSRYESPVRVLTGDTLLLHCQTTGDHVTLAWTLPSGVMLNRLQRAGRYAILANGTLAIRLVSVHDRGRYVCRGSNEHGSSLLSVSVSVIGHAPRITSGPPSVTYAKQGVAVQLNCAATGMPKLEVAWETPDKMRLAVSAQPRLFGNKYLHPQGSLVIQSPTHRDSGVYRCTARNNLGSDSRATFLNVF